MTSEEIHDRLIILMRDMFRNPTLLVSDATVASDVPGWDSLAHIDFVVAVEQAFGISFTTREVRGMENVGALKDILRKKLA